MYLYVLSNGWTSKYYKIGIHGGTLSELITRYITPIPRMIIHLLVQVPCTFDLETYCKDYFENIRVKNVRGNLSEWCESDLDTLLLFIYRNIRLDDPAKTDNAFKHIRARVCCEEIEEICSMRCIVDEDFQKRLTRWLSVHFDMLIKDGNIPIFIRYFIQTKSESPSFKDEFARFYAIYELMQYCVNIYDFDTFWKILHGSQTTRKSKNDTCQAEHKGSCIDAYYSVIRDVLVHNVIKYPNVEIQLEKTVDIYIKIENFIAKQLEKTKASNRYLTRKEIDRVMMLNDIKLRYTPHITKIEKEWDMWNSRDVQLYGLRQIHEYIQSHTCYFECDCGAFALLKAILVIYESLLGSMSSREEVDAYINTIRIKCTCY